MSVEAKRFLKALLPVLVCAGVMLSKNVVAAQPQVPKLIPAGANVAESNQTNDVFTWGLVDGYPFFTSAYKLKGKVSANPCASDRGYIVAKEGAFKAEELSAFNPEKVESSFTKLTRKAALTVHDYCDGKVVDDRVAEGKAPILRKGFQIAWHTPKEMKAVIDTRSGSDSDLPSRYVSFEDIPNSRASQVKTAKEAQQKTEEQARIEARYNSILTRLEANAARLSEWFNIYRIDEFVSIGKIAKNPFAYEGKTLLTVGRFAEAISGKEVLIREARLDRDYAYGELVVSPTLASQWTDTGYLMVVKVKGRYEDNDRYGKPALASVLQTFACKEENCRNDLYLPTAARTGPTAFNYGMKP